MPITSNAISLGFSKRGGSTTVLITYPTAQLRQTPVIADNWCFVTNQIATDNTVEYFVGVDEWDTTAVTYGHRTTTITFSDSQSNTYILEVKQANGWLPIWMDQNIEPTDRVTGEDYSFKVKRYSDTYFRGMTVPLDSSSYPESINMSRICEDYISETFNPALNRNTWNNLDNELSMCRLWHIVDGEDILVDTYHYINDWSYEKKIYNETHSLNDPINGKGTPDMIYPFCAFAGMSSDTGNFKITYTSNLGVTTTDDLPAWSIGVSNYYITDNYYSDTVRIDFKQGSTVLYSYDLTHCGQGALYYRNRYGGYDSFLIEGNITKTESYDREQYTKHTNDNTGTPVYNKITDRTKITTTWKAVTGWLTDEEAERLTFHLLSSPEVYFQPFDDNTTTEQYIAVVLTDTTAEYKKYRNGRQLIQYTINFEDSRKRSVML